MASATSLRQLTNLAEAKPLLERALAIREKALGPDHSAVAATLQELGWLVFDSGDRKGAVRLFRRSLALREQAKGPEHRDVANALQGSERPCVSQEI
jgi:tetratricopeptide (TPR) repeat protein